MPPGRRCQVCAHDKRANIEIALVNKVPVRVIAARFGIHKDAIFRHRKNHLPPQAMAAILTAQRPTAVDLENLERSESEGLLGHLVVQRARLQQLSDQALEVADVRAANAVERTITSNLELVAKLLGQLIQRHEVTRSNILVSPDYLALRATILRALVPHPEARQAVGEALYAMETAAAKDITPAPAAIEARPEAAA